MVTRNASGGDAGRPRPMMTAQPSRGNALGGSVDIATRSETSVVKPPTATQRDHTARSALAFGLAVLDRMAEDFSLTGAGEGATAEIFPPTTMRNGGRRRDDVETARG